MDGRVTVTRRRKTREGTTIGLGFDSPHVHPMKDLLGWCMGKRHCSDCPKEYRSKIETTIVDICKCECHAEGTNGN